MAPLSSCADAPAGAMVRHPPAAERHGKKQRCAAVPGALLVAGAHLTGEECTRAVTQARRRRDAQIADAVDERNFPGGVGLASDLKEEAQKDGERRGPCNGRVEC